MTAEQRVLIEPKDVLAIELTCKCGISVRYPLLKMQPGVFRSSQHRCPNCKEPLATGPESNRIADLADAISVLIESGSDTNIRLEIEGLEDGPEDKA